MTGALPPQLPEFAIKCLQPESRLISHPTRSAKLIWEIVAFCLPSAVAIMARRFFQIFSTPMPQLPWPSPPADAVDIEAQGQPAGFFALFFDAIMARRFFQIFRTPMPQLPWPSPPADVVDIEAQGQLAGLVVMHRPWPSRPTDAVDLEAQRQPAGLVARRPLMAWADIAVAFCLQSAVAIALASIQSQLSSTFYLLLIAMLLAFASFLVSEFMNSKFVVTAQVLRKVGIFFTVTAYFLAITIPFPFHLKVTSCVVYTISFLTILVSRCF